MASRAIIWGGTLFVGLQTAILLGSYLYLRRRFVPVADHVTFRVFRVVFLIAVALTTFGPLAALATLNRLAPYTTPLDVVRPLTVTNMGMNALFLGYVMVLVAMVSLRWVHEQMESA